MCVWLEKCLGWDLLLCSYGHCRTHASFANCIGLEIVYTTSLEENGLDTYMYRRYFTYIILSVWVGPGCQQQSSNIFMIPLDGADEGCPAILNVI